jgi:ribosomal protein S15P/S13E
MPLTQERTQELVTQFGDSPADTGKTEVQVALLTERINTARITARDVVC